MITVPSLKDLAAHDIRSVVVACGVFDGVHRGHQLLMERLRELARRLASLPVVLTFDPHPRQVLDPAGAPPLLTTTEQKLCLLERFGARAAVVMPFTPGLAGLEPEDFLAEHLSPPGLELRGICVGREWRFGARGKGDVGFLERAGRRLGFDVASVPEMLWYGRPVSSTRIRDALVAGRLRTAARLLGRPYVVCGSVVRGKGLGGRRLNCPTANLTVGELLLPPDGVYAVCAGMQCTAAAPTARPRQGIAYIGTSPTVAPQSSAPRGLEVHLFDATEDLYGRELEVEFIEFLRPDRRFASLDALADQMRRDIAAAKNICGRQVRAPAR